MAKLQKNKNGSFKPYYNWNTFNTALPSKYWKKENRISFKPYYNWNTFNTVIQQEFGNEFPKF